MRGWTLFRYLGLQYAIWFIAFFLVLTGIIYLFEVSELLRRAADLAQTTMGVVLRMAAYKMPGTIDKILPFVVLFSGMFTFWKLTRSQELVVARATGISAWQFLAPALLVTLFFGVVNVTLLNPVAAAMTARYEEMDARYFHQSPLLELTGAGLWVRQEDAEKRYLLHADQVQTSPLTLRPLIVFIYDKEGGYEGRIDAATAVLKKGRWELANAWVNEEGEMPRLEVAYSLPTSLTFDRIQESMSPPRAISLWRLPRFIRAVRSIGLPPVRHEIELQTLLAQPLLLCAMVLFAAAFSLRLNRQGGILNAMMAGMFTGSVVFSLNNVVTSLGVNQTLPVILAAWAIPLAALVGGQATLLYLEDG